MKKPVFVALCGWLGLFLSVLGWGDAFVAGFSVRHLPAFSPSVAGACIVFSLPLLVVWVLGTIIHKFQASAAKMRAQAMLDAQAVQAARQAGGRGPQTIAAPPVERTGTR